MKLKIIIYLTIYLLNIGNLYSIENKILLKIDNELITSIDIYNYSKYLVKLDTDLKNLKDEEIYEIAKNLLVKQKIKKIKIFKDNISTNIERETMDSYINSIFASKGINNLDDYEKFIKSINLNYEMMKDYLENELIWNNIIFKKFSSGVKINKNELEKKIRNTNNINTISYLLSEIVFEAKNRSEINQKYVKIKDTIEKDGFKKAALIHSTSDSSSDGGNIGWINENSVNKKIFDIISNLKVKEYSKPILFQGGFLILMLEEKKSIKREINVEKELNRLVNLMTNQQLNRYSNIYFNKVKKEVQINEF